MPCTQNRKIGNLGKFSFTSYFYSSCNLFQICIFQREGEALFFFVTFNTKSRLSWKFPWSSSSCSKDMGIFSLNINTSIFRVFWHFFVTKKLMKSAYNRWCRHFFYFQPTLNRLFSNFIKFRSSRPEVFLRIGVLKICTSLQKNIHDECNFNKVALKLHFGMGVLL